MKDQDLAQKRAVIYNNLSVMLSAGVDIVRSLSTVVSGMTGTVPKALRGIAKDVSRGESITEAMDKYPKAFSEIDKQVIGAGEASGNLPESLKLLSEWHGFCDHLKGIIISKMMLPLILIFVFAFINPAPALFLGRINLPGYFFAAFRTLVLFFGSGALIFAVVRQVPKRGFFRRWFDSLVLKIPVLGNGVKWLAISRFCHVFYMLLKAGLPIQQCVQKATHVTGNIIVADMLCEIDSVKKGNPVSDGFSQKLDRGFTDSWKIGEQTGQLDNTAKRLAENSREMSEMIFTELGIWIPRLIYFLICVRIAISIFNNFSLIRPGY